MLIFFTFAVSLFSNSSIYFSIFVLTLSTWSYLNDSICKTFFLLSISITLYFCSPYLLLYLFALFIYYSIVVLNLSTYMLSCALTIYFSFLVLMGFNLFYILLLSLLFVIHILFPCTFSFYLHYFYTLPQFVLLLHIFFFLLYFSFST